jgi:hypothetical protein
MLGAAGMLDGALMTDPPVDGGEAWGRYAARTLRYRVAWGLYEQNIYARLHGLADSLKDRFDLADSIRSVYAPGYRIGEFWAEHLYASPPDPAAGDGENVPSGVPVAGASDRVRASLAVLWRDSAVARLVEQYGRLGAVLGDVFLKVADDPWRGRVQLQCIHPATVREFEADAVGNCRGYVIERPEPDPDPPGGVAAADAPLVTYREEAWRQGDSVVFATYLDGEPYDWREYATGQPRVGPQWSMAYGFVPLVRVAHRSHAAGWGAGEYHFSAPKLMECDGLASRVCDQLYKIARAPVYFEGMRVKDVDIASSGEGEHAFPILGGEGKPHMLVAPMSVADAVALMRELLARLERDHPELMADDVGAGASGEARREARRKAEASVVRRRVGYDEGLARAQMMALSMGGLGGYEGYEWVRPESYRLGELSHAIGPRPVFAQDERERLQDEEQRGKALSALTAGGVPLRVAMRRAGFTAAEVEEAVRERDAEAEAAVARAARLGLDEAPPPDAADGPEADGMAGAGGVA